MTTQNTELRELSNNVEIVGTLKSKELEIKTSRAGKGYMSGSIVVACEFDGKVQEEKIKVMVMEKTKTGNVSKLFKGIETVMNEYKSIEADGKENADRVRITGNLTLNEYYNGQGKLVQFNEVRGVFFNRLEAHDDQPDKAIASIETVIEGFEPVLDKDQLPTGQYAVQGFTIGWGSDVVALKNTIIGEELAQSFMDLYQPGSTGRLTFKLNNYAETEEVEVQAAPTHGFGSTQTLEREVKNYVNNIEIIGGDMPFFGTKEYTPEEIEAAHKVRALKLQEMQQSASDTPQTNTGFGQGAPSGLSDQQVNNNMPSGMPGGNAMPDFNF